MRENRKAATVVAILVVMALGALLWSRPEEAEVTVPEAVATQEPRPRRARTPPAPPPPAGVALDDRVEPAILRYLAEALDGYRIRCTLPAGMGINAMVSEMIDPVTNTVEWVGNRPDGVVDAIDGDSRVLASWRGARKGAVNPCVLSEPPDVEVELRLVWLDDGSPVTGVELHLLGSRPAVREPVPVVDGVARLHAKQFDTLTLTSAFTGEFERHSVIYQDVGGMLELLVGAPPLEGPLVRTFAAHRPDPAGLTTEMREAMAASIDTTGDMFPAAGFYDESDIDAAVEQAMSEAPEAVQQALAEHASGRP